MSQAIERTDMITASATPAALRLTYSADHGLLYVAFGIGDVADTIEVEETVYVDVDEEGRPLGVEFLHADDLPAFLTRRGGEFIVPARVIHRTDLGAASRADSGD
jgi:uncharacterized protein YuzE